MATGASLSAVGEGESDTDEHAHVITGFLGAGESRTVVAHQRSTRFPEQHSTAQQLPTHSFAVLSPDVARLGLTVVPLVQ